MKRARNGTTASGVIGLVALLGTPLVACGARSGLPVPDQDSVLPGDSSTCKGIEVPVYPHVPNLYFVLDVSGSMLMDSKWQNVRSAVATLIEDLGARARFGAAVFPAPLEAACAPGVERMPLQLGDDQGTVAKTFLAATALTPNGGTPTASTFRALAPELESALGVTYAILATDGGPNCGAAAACPIDQCTSNIDRVTDSNGNPLCSPGVAPNCCDMNGQGCLDGDATTGAIAELQQAGVLTYVMGIPGSSPYGSVLDGMAIAGGTARPAEPRYYDVTTADTSALGSAFNQIANDAMKNCTFVLENAPVDGSKINVYVNGQLLPADGPNGWTEHGSAVMLQGATCELVQSDAGPPPVQVFSGCPTVH
ncbi:MAG TPA: vWA domain-containing protein [Polyangiaceae bacterium]